MAHVRFGERGKGNVFYDIFNKWKEPRHMCPGSPPLEQHDYDLNDHQDDHNQILIMLANSERAKGFRFMGISYTRSRAPDRLRTGVFVFAP